MSRKLTDAAPQLELRKAEDVGIFNLIDAPQWKEKTKFGTSWLMKAVDVTDGQIFGFFWKTNGFRDTQCTQLVDAFKSSSEPIGPLHLVKENPEKGGNWYWDMRDYTGEDSNGKDDRPFE